MFKSLNPVYKGIVFALVGYSGFAVSDASAKFLTASLPPFHIVVYIALCACIFLALLSPWLGGFSRPKPQMVKFHVLRAFMNFMISITIVMAFTQLSLATVYTIVFAKPFIAALIAIPFYGEKVRGRHWAVIALGFTGIFLAMRPSPEGFNLALLLPLITALCSAIMWVSSQSMKGETPFAMGFYSVLGTVVLCLPFVVFDPQMPALSQLPFFMICGAGISFGVVGLSLAFQSAPSSSVAPFHYSQMVWGIVLGYLVFGDVPGLHTLIGAAIIIGSGLYLILSERDKTAVQS